MKKLLLLLHFTFGILNFAFSQTAPGIEWQNTIGGNKDDLLFSLQQTHDGGYILGGYSFSQISGDKTENTVGGIGDHDYWIIKIDSGGNIQWQNTIGGSDDDDLYSIQQTPDGGYIMGGSSNSPISGDKTENSKGGDDYWIVKTDSLGDLQWQTTIGGSGGDQLRVILPTTDMGFIIGGYSWSNISGDKTEICNGVNDFWIVKIDSTGNIQWQNTIGGSSADELSSICTTADGGYILGGRSESNISGDKTENSMGLSDFWIVKIDYTGNIQWQNTIGGSLADVLNTLQQTSDMGYILGGQSSSNISGDKTENNWDPTLQTQDFWIVKTDSIGNIQWQKTIGGSSWDKLLKICQTNNGEYMLGGGSSSNISGNKTENSNGATDIWILNIDSTANIQWQNTIGGGASEWLYSLVSTIDGGNIIGGWSSSNISGDKTENNWDTICNPSCTSDYWIIKLYPDTTTGIANIQPSTNNIQLYPNPTKDEITINGYTLQNNQPAQLKIFDVMGNVVLAQTVTTLNLKLKTENFANGVYFMQLQSGVKVSRAKFVKQ